MKITENDNTITATETLKFKDFSPKEQERFFDMIWKDGLTLEEAKERMVSQIIDEMISHFDKENFVFPDTYVDKKNKVKSRFYKCND